MHGGQNVTTTNPHNGRVSSACIQISERGASIGAAKLDPVNYYTCMNFKTSSLARPIGGTMLHKLNGVIHMQKFHTYGL